MDTKPPQKPELPNWALQWGFELTFGTPESAAEILQAAGKTREDADAAWREWVTKIDAFEAEQERAKHAP